jgi:hypothetical protein
VELRLWKGSYSRAIPVPTGGSSPPRADAAGGGAPSGGNGGRGGARSSDYRGLRLPHARRLQHAGYARRRRMVAATARRGRPSENADPTRSADVAPATPVKDHGRAKLISRLVHSSRRGTGLQQRQKLPGVCYLRISGGVRAEVTCTSGTPGEKMIGVGIRPLPHEDALCGCILEVNQERSPAPRVGVKWGVHRPRVPDTQHETRREVLPGD